VTEIPHPNCRCTLPGRIWLVGGPYDGESVGSEMPQRFTISRTNPATGRMRTSSYDRVGNLALFKGDTTPPEDHLAEE
jgi:hypothetical protein